MQSHMDWWPTFAKLAGLQPPPHEWKDNNGIRSVVQTTRVLVTEVADGLHDLAGVVAELHQGVEIGAPAGRLALESRGGVVRVVHLEEAEIHEEGIGILCVRLTSIDGDQVRVPEIAPKNLKSTRTPRRWHRRRSTARRSSSRCARLPVLPRSPSRCARAEARW
jgi:hypothetical protein